MVFFHIDLLAQRTDHLLVQFPGKFHSHRTHALSLLDQILHRFPVIQVFIIDGFRINICISGDTEKGFFLHGIVFEHFRQKVKDQFFGEHESSFSGRNVDQTSEDVVAAWNDSHSCFSAFGFQKSHCVNVFVFQEWKGLLFAHHIGRQIGRNLIVKIGFQKLSFFCG